MIETEKKPYTIQAITLDTPNQWKTYLPASRSVFGSVEFNTIQEAHNYYRPLLFVFQQEETTISYPLLLRGFFDLPFTPDGTLGWDIKTPEYTGPIPLTQVSPQEAANFRKAFREFCRSQNIIAEFAHLHPWNDWRPLLEDGVRFDRDIIYVDLTIPVDQMWQQSFNHACRKNIQRARRENVRTFPARSPDEILEFHRIYTETMDRNQAASHYYFSPEYFLQIFHTMPENALFMLADYKDQIVAGTLYLHDDENVYSYLGGADHTFQQVRPTNAVVYETICWAQQRQKRRLILGGGFRPGDGIFRFKSSFSPLSAPFYTYRKIHRVDQYKILCDAWSSHYKRGETESQYFPRYRDLPRN